MDNRTIKFRVWDKISKEMAYPDNGLKGSTDEGFSHLYQSFLTKGKFGPNELFNESNLIITQYTGEKDENNDDIYEGDILFWPNRQMEALVKFGAGKFFLEDVTGGYTEDMNKHFPFKIIGNIFQTPELLEKV